MTTFLFHFALLKFQIQTFLTFDMMRYSQETKISHFRMKLSLLVATVFDDLVVNSFKPWASTWFVNEEVALAADL